jgi:hypothetical protein
MAARDESRALAIRTSELISELQEIHPLRARLWSALIEYAADWFDKKSQQVVAAENNIILTPEHLAELKRKVRVLYIEANSVIRDEVDGPELWWPEDLDEHGSQFSAELLQKLRYALGRLAPILETYGYLREEPAWRLHTPGFQTFTNSRPYYPDDLEYSAALADAVEQYKCRLVAAHKLCTMTSNLRERLRTSE